MKHIPLNLCLTAMMKKLIKNFLTNLFIISISFAQPNNPEAILRKVVDTFNKIQDYEVNVNIKIDVEFLKAPETKAKIYFKQPDKIHFESETFAMLPREGFDFSPNSLLKRKYTAFFERIDTVDNFKTAVIKVIPIGESDDVILSTLWVDQNKFFVRKVESTTKFNGTFSIELKYDHSDLNYPLPSSMIFTFNVDRMNLPRGFSGDLSNEKGPKKRDDKPTTTGKVYITYSDYKVNTGISDKFFEDKNKRK